MSFVSFDDVVNCFDVSFLSVLINVCGFGNGVVDSADGTCLCSLVYDATLGDATVDSVAVVYFMAISCLRC